ncbi:MAG: hypothetical protein AAF804_03315 [Bacteroidota bacterium]
MRKISPIILFITALSLGSGLFAQSSLGLEAGGKVFFTASLNYEYRFEDSPFGFGASLGFGRIENGDIIRQAPGGGNETGRYTDLIIPVSVYGLASWGDRHRFVTNLGLTGQNQFAFNRYPSGNENFAELLLAGVLGLGYEWHPGPWALRVMPYAIYIGEEASGFFPPLLPWLGVMVIRELGG